MTAQHHGSIVILEVASADTLPWWEDAEGADATVPARSYPQDSEE